MNKQPPMDRLNHKLDVYATGSEASKDRYSLEDDQFLEQVRRQVRTDFSSDSKIRHTLRERLVQQSNNPVKRGWRGLPVFSWRKFSPRRFTWAGMSMILILLLGLTFRNLNFRTSLASPNQSTAFLPGAVSETIVPATSSSATQSLTYTPARVATPGVQETTTGEVNPFTPLPVVSPVMISIPR